VREERRQHKVFIRVPLTNESSPVLFTSKIVHYNLKRLQMLKHNSKRLPLLKSTNKRLLCSCSLARDLFAQAHLKETSSNLNKFKRDERTLDILSDVFTK
jgi:hypothetical protein